VAGRVSERAVPDDTNGLPLTCCSIARPPFLEVSVPSHNQANLTVRAVWQRIARGGGPVVRKRIATGPGAMPTLCGGIASAGRPSDSGYCGAPDSGGVNRQVSGGAGYGAFGAFGTFGARHDWPGVVNGHTSGGASGTLRGDLH